MSSLPKNNHSPAFQTAAGSLDEVHAKIANLPDHRFIAFGFAPGKAVDIKAVQTFLELAVNLLEQGGEAKQQEKIEALIDAFAPDVAPPSHVLKEAAMTIRARSAVIEQGNWLTAVEVAEAAGFSMKNPSAQPNKWKHDGQIFTIKNKGVEYFPGYGLDPASQYRPVTALGKVIAIFKEKKSGWGLAYWFASVNGALGGQRPQDVLLAHPEAVIVAAKDEMAKLDGVWHG